MALTTSFAGLTTGIDTNALVQAIMSQQSKGLDRLTAQQTKSKAKATAVTEIKNGINALGTSLAVLQDKMNTGDTNAVTAAMQDAVTKLNAVEKLYKVGATVTKGSDGSIVQGPLYGDPTLKDMMSQIKTAFSGLTSLVTSSFTNPASIGVKTGADGNLAVDSAAFQAAWVSNPGAVKSIAGFTNLRDIVSKDTASTSDAPILQIQQRIDAQNKLLTTQVDSTTQILAKKEAALKAQFSKMETVIAQLKAAAGSLTGA